MVLVANEEAKMEECYYDICNGYSEAWVDGNICYCYDYDVMGNLNIVDEKYMK